MDIADQVTSAAWHRVWERAIGARARLFQERTAAEKALTLIHGDAHMDNVLVPRRGGRPCIIDWEGLARGLGIWDLSRLLLCFPFPPGMRYDLERILVPRYHRRVEAAGIGGYSLEMCKSDYRLCILANIPHVLVWGDPAYMRATMEAWRDWECEALLF